MQEKSSNKHQPASCSHARETRTPRVYFGQYPIRLPNKASCTRYPDCHRTLHISNPIVRLRHVAIAWKKYAGASFHRSFNSTPITIRSVTLRVKFTASQAVHQHERAPVDQRSESTFRPWRWWTTRQVVQSQIGQTSCEGS